MSELPSPFAEFGGEPAVTKLVARFYALMAEREPALARLHRCEPDGTIAAESQERFRLFLIGWLGGPQTYMERHGHPRLRMRHARVPVDAAMRDAWVRSMDAALEEGNYPPAAKGYIQQRLAEVADFLRNQE